MSALPIIQTSAIDAATDALVTLIRARVATDCPNVPVSVGHPGVDVEAEHIWTDGHIDDEDQAQAVSGLVAKDETFTIRVRCLATLHADEFHEVRDRCSILRDAVMNAVRDDYTLAGTVMLATVTGIEPEQAHPGNGQHSAGDTIRVRCQAYLR